MAGNSNGKGASREAGSPPARSLNTPNTFCLFCCQLFKVQKQDNIMPAITWTVIFVNNMPVAVPTCIDHLETPSTSSLIH